MALALAASVREDNGWPMSVKNQVIEELLFEVDELDEPILQVDSDDADNNVNDDGLRVFHDDDDDDNDDDDDTDENNNAIKNKSVNRESKSNENKEMNNEGPFGLPG